MATDQQPALERLSEYADSRGQKLVIDRDKCVVHDVKLLGLASKNGREYTRESAVKAIPLYEGAASFVDHGAKGQNRSYLDRLGTVCNVRESVDKSGLSGDFHYNPKHPAAEQFLWDAEHAPGNVGFSHVVEARVSRKDGRVIVEEIAKVESVDLVAKPATTKTLFEDEQEAINADPVLRQLSEGWLSAISDLRAAAVGPGLALGQRRAKIAKVLDGWKAELREGEIANQIAVDEASERIEKICDTAIGLCHDVTSRWYSREKGHPYPTAESKKTRLLQILADWTEELNKPLTTTATESVDMDVKTLTVEQLKESRPDLVAVLTGTDETTKLQTELKEAKDKLAAIEAEKAALAKTATISEELKAAKLDASDKVAVSEAFMATLTAAPDAAARKTLIEDRVAILAKSHRSAGVTTGAPFVPLAEGVTGGPGKTCEETLKRLR